MCQVKAKCYGNCALWHNLEGLLSRSSLKVIKDSYGPTTKKPLQKSCLVSFASETVVQNYLRGQFSFESARNKTCFVNCVLKKKIRSWLKSKCHIIDLIKCFFITTPFNSAATEPVDTVYIDDKNSCWKVYSSRLIQIISSNMARSFKRRFDKRHYPLLGEDLDTPVNPKDIIHFRQKFPLPFVQWNGIHCL